MQLESGIDFSKGFFPQCFTKIYFNFYYHNSYKEQFGDVFHPRKIISLIFKMNAGDEVLLIMRRIIFEILVWK